MGTDVCPKCGKGGGEAVLCFRCNGCPADCKCDAQTTNEIPVSTDVGSSDCAHPETTIAGGKARNALVLDREPS